MKRKRDEVKADHLDSLIIQAEGSIAEIAREFNVYFRQYGRQLAGKRCYSVRNAPLNTIYSVTAVCTINGPLPIPYINFRKKFQYSCRFPCFDNRMPEIGSA